MSKKEKIIKYLKDKGVYEQFVNNIKTKNVLLKKLLMDRNLIAKAFDWHVTPEGLDFWGKVYDEYCDWYEEEFADEFLYINSI